jgi:hypothetical protein
MLDSKRKFLIALLLYFSPFKKSKGLGLRATMDY